MITLQITIVNKIENLREVLKKEEQGGVFRYEKQKSLRATNQEASSCMALHSWACKNIISFRFNVSLNPTQFSIKKIWTINSNLSLRFSKNLAKDAFRAWGTEKEPFYFSLRHDLNLENLVWWKSWKYIYFWFY